MGSSSFTAILSLQANGFTICDEMDMQVSKATVLSAKSDSCVVSCLHSYQGLESMNHLCLNPIHRIGLIRKLSIDSRMLK